MPDPDLRTENQHFCLRALHELIDIGLEIARGLQQADPAPDLTVKFERVSRAVRRAIRLAHYIAEPRPAQTAPDPARHRTEARKRIIREVEDAIQHPPRDTTNTAPLRAELLDRLDSPELEDEIAHRPVADIIADIIHDLGVGEWTTAHAYRRRTPGDVQTLHARAAAPPGTIPRTPEPAPPPRPKPRGDEPDPELIQLAQLLAGPYSAAERSG